MDVINSHCEEEASFHYSDADADGQISLDDARKRWKSYGLSDLGASTSATHPRRLTRAHLSDIQQLYHQMAQLGAGASGITFKGVRHHALAPGQLSDSCSKCQFKKAFTHIWKPVERQAMDRYRGGMLLRAEGGGGTGIPSCRLLAAGRTEVIAQLARSV